jgi:hypothetical protein
LPPDLARRDHCRAPACKRSIFQRHKAFIASRQIGQQAVNPGCIEPPHHLKRKAPQLVGFVKPRGANQHLYGPCTVKSEEQFLTLRRAIKGWYVSRENHSRGQSKGGLTVA